MASSSATSYAALPLEQRKVSSDKVVTSALSTASVISLRVSCAVLPSKGPDYSPRPQFWQIVAAS
jgi:hypothetical protein